MDSVEHCSAPDGQPEVVVELDASPVDEEEEEKKPLDDEDESRSPVDEDDDMVARAARRQWRVPRSTHCDTRLLRQKIQIFTVDEQQTQMQTSNRPLKLGDCSSLLPLPLCHLSTLSLPSACTAIGRRASALGHCEPDDNARRTQKAKGEKTRRRRQMISSCNGIRTTRRRFTECLSSTCAEEVKPS
jgi:hypothetical protein